MKDRKEILIKLESIFWNFLSGIQEHRLQRLTEDTIIQDLVDKYWLDSLDLIELLMKIEKEFSISIPDVKAEVKMKISELIDVIIELQSEPQEDREGKKIIYCSATSNLINVVNALITEDIAFTYHNNKVLFSCQKKVLEKIQSKHDCLLYNVERRDI